jgi:type I restriction-modification system DNA methylase subunit
MDMEENSLTMDLATHNKIASFIWGIAGDVLRDLFRHGKYPDVILPMCMLRRLDAVLEPTKAAVLDTRKMLDEARITEQRAALCGASGQASYNTSRFTLRDLKSRGSQQQLLADFEDYLDGFSPNVEDILDNFKFRNQLSSMRRTMRKRASIARRAMPCGLMTNLVFLPIEDQLKSVTFRRTPRVKPVARLAGGLRDQLMATDLAAADWLG